MIIALAFSAGITHSYFIDKKDKLNIISTDTSEILIEENFKTPPCDLVQNTTYTKEVSVKNLRTTSWIRMRIEVNNSELEKKIRLNFNNDGSWKKNEDGYYYYTKPVERDKVTSPVLYSVTALENIPSGMLNVICFAESVQAERYNTGTEPYMDAFARIQ